MLEYRIREGAETEEPNPAFILVHGYGSNADDLFSFAPHLPKQYTIISIQAPLSIGFGGYAWYPISFETGGKLKTEISDAWNAVELIANTIDELINIHNLNSKDITYLGFSQGAILGWAFAYTYPYKVRRLIALSGFIHESVSVTQTTPFQVFASHGTNDTVISIDLPRTSILPLQKLNPSITYYEYPEGHTICQKNFYDLLDWIAKTT
ncbi:MAG: alpha/beta fold hydrolase [Flavobacteriaceae bacterium]